MPTQHTTISWTNRTWNPLRGCALVSPGCTHCYAMKHAWRFHAEGQPYAGLTRQTGKGPVWTGEVRMVPEALAEPVRWKTPTKIFVNSMSDLYHESVPEAFIVQVFAVMYQAPWHQYQILTKRHERLATLAPRLPWGPQIWQGVSIENAAYVHRIAALQGTPAHVKFLSLEPLLGPLPGLDLQGIDWVRVILCHSEVHPEKYAFTVR